MASSGSDSGTTPLQNAMKMAKVAIQLDAGDRHKEAYCEYLRSINYISHALLEDAVSKKEGEMVAMEVERMLRLAEQCLERAKSFIGRREEPSDLSSSSPFSSSLPGQSGALNTQTTHLLPTTTTTKNTVVPDSNIDQEPKPSSSSRRGHRRVLSEGDGEPSPFLPPEVFHRLQAVESQDLSRKELTPIEEASRLNQKLKASYEARLARLMPGQAYQKTSLISKMSRHPNNHVDLRAYWRKLKAFGKTLSLQRQMMENLIIAKARQDALQRKMEERRQRLQEEANRRFASLGKVTAEEEEQRVLYTNVLEYEQDHEWPKVWKANLMKNPNDASLASGLVSYLLSRTDHPVMKLLRKHQYRVYNRLYPIVSKSMACSPNLPLKSSLSAHSLLHSDSQKNPTRPVGGVVVGHSLVSDPLLSPSIYHSHDLHANEEEDGGYSVTRLGGSLAAVSVERENSFEDLEQFLTQLDWVPPFDSGDDTVSDADLTFEPSIQLEQDDGHVEEMETRALKEHLKAIVKDIHIAIDQLLSLCLLSFECLNTAGSKDMCVASIEEAFFRPLWCPLLALFRKVHRERELSFACSMKLYHNASPADVGVPLKLFPQDPVLLQGSYPYESAVQELKLLLRDCCPQRKLECIVRTLRLICACAEDYRCLHEVNSTPKTAAIGADDLLPILSFVALRCESPQLVSECAALEEFIHEGYLIGEEGYCLTSMQSALSYIESLHTGGSHLCIAKLT